MSRRLALMTGSLYCRDGGVLDGGRPPEVLVMTLIIVDYDAGNLRSVFRACRAVGIDASMSSDPDVIAAAERVIFPGVGHAGAAMETLKRRGLDAALRAALDRGAPVLGVCVGAQLILERSEESPIPCLGLIRGETRRFRPSDSALKVPHMGWNAVEKQQPHPLLEGLSPGDEFYFVHSYYPVPQDPKAVYATAHHGEEFCCALGKDNLFATQFHPEKSGKLGLALLERFSRWEGTPC